MLKSATVADAQIMNERFNSVFQNAAVGIAIVGTDGAWIDVNRKLCEILGYTPDELATLTFQDITHPDDLETDLGLMGEVLNGARESYSMEKRYFRKDGSLIEANLTVGCTRNDAGDVSFFVSTVEDISEKKRAFEALADSEDRLREVIDGVLGFASVLDLDGVLLETNEHSLQAIGARREDVIGKPFWECPWWRHDESARQRLRQAIETCRNGDVVRYDVEIWIAGDGRMTVDFKLFPRKDKNGRVIEIIPSGIDITDRKRAMAQRELLLDELNHRIKNTLASIQAIAMETFSTAESAESFESAFMGRLSAIATCHDMLTRPNAEGADIKELLRLQVCPYVGDNQSRISLSGPLVSLTPSVAHAFGLVFHELSTNAAKYGSLSTMSGVLDVGWRVAETMDGAVLKLDWVESGGPKVRPPAREGFGTYLVQHSLSHALGGQAQIDYAEKGLRASFELPLET